MSESVSRLVCQRVIGNSGVFFVPEKKTASLCSTIPQQCTKSGVLSERMRRVVVIPIVHDVILSLYVSLPLSRFVIHTS